MILLQCMVFLLLICLYWVTKNKEFDKIPGPPGIFLLHNALDFLMDPVELFYYFRRLANTYNGLFKVRFGPVKFIILHNPEDIEKVINGTKCSEKGLMYKFLEPWLKEGLLVSKGQKWHQRRKLVTPAFHFDVLSNFKSIIEENCQSFVDKLEKQVNVKKTVIMSYVNDFAINTICETVMGAKLDEEDVNSSKMYKEGIYKLGRYAVYRAQRIWMYPNFIFKFTALGKKMETILKKLTSFRDRVIENRKNLLNDYIKVNLNDEHNGDEKSIVKLSGKRKMALLDLLLLLEKDGVIDAKGIGEEVDLFMFAIINSNSVSLTHATEALESWKVRYPNDDIAKEYFTQKLWDVPLVPLTHTNLVQNLTSERDRARFLALSEKESGYWLHVLPSKNLGTLLDNGHDTSANTLQFAMMLFANNQDAQEKVVMECKEIFGSSTLCATMADLAQMKYLECCIKECLRLYPPVPILNRTVKETITLGNYQIPAGTEYGILIFDVHRRGDQFVEPLEFRPERFLTEPTWHPYAYIPFSAGPRNCIGQKYAMMQLKLVLSALLRRYRLLPVTKPNDIIFVMDYVLRVKDPIYVKLEERYER